jgi:hypothetical protein
MNKNAILFNLVEAREELDSTINELESDLGYGEPELMVAMMHLFHHVNTAWNARNSTAEEWQNCSDEDFNRWGRYPTDLVEIAIE